MQYEVKIFSYTHRLLATKCFNSETEADKYFTYIIPKIAKHNAVATIGRKYDEEKAYG